MYGTITLQYSGEDEAVGDDIVIETRVGKLTVSARLHVTSLILEGWDGSIIFEHYYENKDFPNDMGA